MEVRIRSHSGVSPVMTALRRWFHSVLGEVRHQRLLLQFQTHHLAASDDRVEVSMCDSEKTSQEIVVIAKEGQKS